MYTRCTGCHAVHAVNADLLASGNGRFRCGRCNKAGNALDALFDELPQAGASPSSSGEVPVLGATVDLKSAAEKRRNGDLPPPADDETDLELPDNSGTGSETIKRLVWILGLITVLLVGSFMFAEFLGRPIPEQAWVQKIKVSLGLAEEKRKRPFRNLQAIRVVNREMAMDPRQPGRLILNATIVNRAEAKQSYPYIEVRLMNSAGRVLSSSRYAPRDYLASGSDVTAGMQPDAYLPFRIEIDDPGRRAVGFELNFQ